MIWSVVLDIVLYGASVCVSYFTIRTGLEMQREVRRLRKERSSKVV